MSDDPFHCGVSKMQHSSTGSGEEPMQPYNGQSMNNENYK